MAFTHHLSPDQVSLESGSDPRRAITAHADKSHSAAWKALDCGNTDILFHAPGDRFPLVYVEVDGPAHDLAFRFAAARASRALE
jgi:hypothetical protein